MVRSSLAGSLEPYQWRRHSKGICPNSLSQPVKGLSLSVKPADTIRAMIFSRGWRGGCGPLDTRIEPGCVRHM